MMPTIRVIKQTLPPSRLFLQPQNYQFLSLCVFSRALYCPWFFVTLLVHQCLRSQCLMQSPPFCDWLAQPSLLQGFLGLITEISFAPCLQHNPPFFITLEHSSNLQRRITLSPPCFQQKTPFCVCLVQPSTLQGFFNVKGTVSWWALSPRFFITSFNAAALDLFFLRLTNDFMFFTAVMGSSWLRRRLWWEHALHCGPRRFVIVS